MNAQPSMEKIEFFLRTVFDYLDRYTEFTERPMSDERHWIGVNAPVVQLIFLDDVAFKRPILTSYVTLFVTGQVFTTDQYVDACVRVLQSLREEDLPDIVVEYTNNLVEGYAQSLDIMKPAIPGLEVAAQRAAAEEVSKPELDCDAAIEESPAPEEDEPPPPDKLIERSTAPAPALGEEEKPISETPVEDEKLQPTGLSVEESYGWK